MVKDLQQRLLTCGNSPVKLAFKVTIKQPGTFWISLTHTSCNSSVHHYVIILPVCASFTA